MEKNNDDIYSEIRQLEIKITRIESSFSRFEDDIKRLVTLERFNPVAYIAYGLAGGVLTTALGAILSTVFIKG